MKNLKTFALLALIIPCSAIRTSDDNSDFRILMNKIGEKLSSSAHSVADWMEYYKNVTMHNLEDWVTYCRNTTKDDVQSFKNFMCNENDTVFQTLNKAQQEAIKDLNKFYADMSVATKEQQDVLVKAFSKRWKQCQQAFSNMKDSFKE